MNKEKFMEYINNHIQAYYQDENRFKNTSKYKSKNITSGKLEILIKIRDVLEGGYFDNE